MKPLQLAINVAIQQAKQSPCQKSKRGVAAYFSGSPIVGAFNGPPAPFQCPGTATCGQKCRELARHAESRALRAITTHSDYRPQIELTLVHVKVVDGELVPSGPPSCLPCAAEIVEANANLWLFHDTGWKLYPGQELYQLSLRHHGLHGAFKSPRIGP